MINPSTLSRRNILLAFTVVSLLLVLLTSTGRVNTGNPRAPTAPLHISNAKPTAPATTAEAQALCKKHNFSPYRGGPASERKIYDTFLFSHELDWLEIRLETLADHVDYFVIVESPTTFTGLDKPLYLSDNWTSFERFHHKIIHKVVTDPGPSIGKSTWVHEDFFRNSLFHSTFPTLLHSDKEAKEGDIILVSDVDEIPKPETLNVLRHCDIPDRLTLRSRFYYYSFQWLHQGEDWPHPQATVYHGLTGTIPPNDLRNGIGSWWSTYWEKAEMWDAAWHCSSCFATIGEMRDKMSSFSHTPLNTEENRDEKTMLDRVRNGLDLFGRVTERFLKVDNNEDVPQYVLDHSKRYKYLLDRDGEDAGFTDWSLRPEGWLKSDDY